MQALNSARKIKHPVRKHIKIKNKILKACDPHISQCGYETKEVCCAYAGK